VRSLASAYELLLDVALSDAARPVGEIALTFLKEFTRFEDRARNVAEPN